MTKLALKAQLLKTHGKLTQHQIVVAYLWEVNDWVPAHEIIKLKTDFGFVGSAGDVRARELARNDCPIELQNKIVSEDGGKLGKDSRYVYFKYQPKGTDYWNNKERLAMFAAV